MAGRKINSKWEWYAVKMLFECIITGEPSPETIDKNCPINHKTYEESIILVKAQSFEHAYSLAVKKSKINETSYYNCYDQMVELRFVRFLDAFNLFDEKLKSGRELYSRFLHVPIDIQTDEVVGMYHPETQDADENGIDYKFGLRYREFNTRPKGI